MPKSSIRRDLSTKATLNKLCFLPFQLGPRTCIGQNFAFLEAKVALSLISQKFRVQPSPSYKHGPVLAIALHPQYAMEYP
ncbi:hypothetical protein NL676_039497 [Syzygium grande]|nr:hypothetical protein NL676_039497 [Syzygium grande]